jgi:hypothetical protein
MPYGVINADKQVDSLNNVFAPASSVMKNRIINGAMVINQRGTQTGSPFNGYTLDRWLFSRTGTGSSTISQVSNSNYGGQYAMSMVSSLAATEIFGTEQRIESYNSADLAGKTITVQFYASATTSAGSLGNFSFNLSYATATDNWTTATIIGSSNFVPTSTPTLFTAQFSVPSAATTGLKLQISGSQSGATGTITFLLGGVQLEAGTNATNFEYRQYGTELALCQRYYWQWAPSQYARLCVVYADTSTSVQIAVSLPVILRTQTPSGTMANMSFNGTALTLTGTNCTNNIAWCSASGTSLTVGAGQLYATGASGNIFSLSSEL